MIDTAHGLDPDGFAGYLPDPFDLLVIKRDMLDVEEILASVRSSMDLEDNPLELSLIGYTSKEIATMCGISQGAAKTRIFRWRNAVQAAAMKSCPVYDKERRRVIKSDSKSVQHTIFQFERRVEDAP